ncbi:methylated-DNA--[protein]-cysteine S-methyltransferase [Aggregatibacter actinomycetemcomitans]|uniref:methylated-DNA--[protein]-cysteine S-methyltransferase n=1 Tax=Aggregatibacter actinomycetemcomitans TaxID=714 RepID=UPI0011D83A68|nr:methylated-DNA--[protein]-cysteine S-methyltransferase [Aggregatibacter actinomycetemcomitans]QEH46092.1 methylated-DNA--[protein]-cysteine S-methyltransferase [Aggregatibacter actinomycetemcomitans]QEH50120.1 methylated-DNA--[protein]-cysteine S-methyltransferase [Aggregatibacter actinomycetemcomitans]TYA51228.1 methylated-DNA--[protein]-cysteine S-methyltransferase [Aggregatibacter actinomycetemcomitans]TYB29433.1 methylated-DNA--[protein]-cysteine S-methyltransferase [Aggregatibacter acti
MTALFYRYYPSPLGNLLMLSDGKNLTNLDFELEQLAPNPKWQEKNELSVFIHVCTALDRYFNGEPETFADIPLAPRGTEFQQQIWQALRQIGYGQTASYGELAKRINNPKAVRAVGGAVGSNPISIIIPCHRILGKDGTLTGFGGGLVAKRFLLQLENISYIDKGKEIVKPRFFKKYRQ